MGALVNKYNFKLKEAGPTSYHLGCDISRHGNDDPCLSPRKRIDKMLDSRVSIFGSKPKSTWHSCLEKDDYPELNTTNFLDADDTQED